MKSILKIVLFCLGLPSVIEAQNVSEQWVARYNGTANTFDGGYSLALDGSGNIYVTGSSFGSGTSRDYLTIKYNSTGTEQWVKRYNGEANAGDYSFSVAVDASGNVYVTGRSDRAGIVLSDITTIKYNPAGVQQWVTHYNGPGNGVDEGIKVLVDNSGNVYVTGRSLGSGTDQDIVTIKYNPTDGSILWAKRYNGPASSVDVSHSMVLDASGNIYVTGESIGNSTGQDYVVIKYDPLSVEMWVRRYNGPGNGGDVANSIGLDGAGNVFVTGYSDGGGTLHDYATLKYNSSGVQQWLQRYNGTENKGDFANSVALDVSGNVYVTGGTVSPLGTNDSNFATVKYNSSGVQQ
ncbi:MAG: SBBP repeat-containing protein, partial [Ignavibacteria bacterium]